MPFCEGNHTREDSKKDLIALEDTLYVIGGKWKLKIINALYVNGNSRFNQLQQIVTGISARVLSKELKEMELNGFIKRNVYTDTPVVITYGITSYCSTLGPVLSTLIEWGNTHKDKIRKDYRN
ncbi:HxlR family transcriptional regulator [Pedobacter lusitanus]|uniref:HxlR family transcriptional regulator n=1 Tax=Pedobacter lusitanus TaxID=1503925 RepID=A0A0D0FQ31_9SPHI|nr:HxlR family transcriptional regulator [Pedobacter lusitanus]